MREKTTADRDLAGASDVFDSGAMTKSGKCLSIARESVLWLFAETHQCFLATLNASADQHVIDFRRRHRPCVGVVRVLSESAITAPVAAEIRYREKNLAGVGDHRSFAFVAQG